MKTSYLLSCAFIVFLSACSKKNDTDKPPVTTDPYLNTASGSSWTYHLEDNSTGSPQSYDYTVTSSGNDTTINGKTYHIYHNSAAGNEYMNITGNNYYKFESIPGTSSLGGITAERLYLKDNLNTGATWKQDFSIKPDGSPIPITFSLNNKIAEKGISRTVNNIAYNDVIHVTSTLSSGLIPSENLTSAIDMYYSPDYGLIESSIIVDLNYMSFVQKVNIVTKLQSAVLK